MHIDHVESSAKTKPTERRKSILGVGYKYFIGRKAVGWKSSGLLPIPGSTRQLPNTDLTIADTYNYDGYPKNVQSRPIPLLLKPAVQSGAVKLSPYSPLSNRYLQEKKRNCR